MSKARNKSIWSEEINCTLNNQQERVLAKLDTFFNDNSNLYQGKGIYSCISLSKIENKSGVEYVYSPFAKSQCNLEVSCLRFSGKKLDSITPDNGAVLAMAKEVFGKNGIEIPKSLTQ